jgi:chaperone required for assembly of F1-ATPase
LWSAVSLDERFQLDQWGKDEEAEERLAAARAEFMDAADYCALVLQRGAV